MPVAIWILPLPMFRSFFNRLFHASADTFKVDLLEHATGSAISSLGRQALEPFHATLHRSVKFFIRGLFAFTFEGRFCLG